MLRVLLVIDDYNELVYLQTLLKKIGFDVDGIQNQKKFEETLLVFNPQAIIATARGKRVDGVALVKELIQRMSPPKLILLRTLNQTFAEGELDLPQIHQVLESPVNARQLLETLAQISDLDEQMLIEKYNKIKASPDEEQVEDVFQVFQQSIYGSGSKTPSTSDQEVSDKNKPSISLKPTTMSEEQRQERFQAVLENVGASEHDGLDISKVRAYNRKVRSGENIDELKDLEEERRDFVRALFSRKKSGD